MVLKMVVNPELGVVSLIYGFTITFSFKMTLRGGSLSDFFRIIIFKIIVVKNLSMVGRTFESVLGPPGHMGSTGPSDPL